MQTNYGLNLDLEAQHQSDEDYIYGGLSTVCLVNIPEIERISYLPEGEVQVGLEDMMDCGTRGPVNILETKFNWMHNHNMSLEDKKWHQENGYVNSEGKIEFSDAFIAIKSNTTRVGNSIKAPLQAINDYGLIPKKMLPLEKWMTFDDYHDKGRITRTMEKLGKEHKRRFPIYYEKVYSIHFGEVYKDDMLVLAGFAWPSPVNGEYPSVEDPFNHIFMGISNPKHMIFDNYIDEVDNDFIKKLASDYRLFEYGYRLYIEKGKKSGFSLFNFLKSLWS